MNALANPCLLARHCLLAAILWVLCPAPPLPAAQADEEERLLQVLRSDSSLADKDAACARLKWIGTHRSVPVLATLLADEPLSHSARYALESLNDPEAGRALRGALDQTTGLTRIGIINSIGVRRDLEAVAALGRLLDGGDTEASAAAARALGAIGGAEALAHLHKASPKTSGPLHAAIVDGQLRCAARWLESGSRAAALAAYQRVYATEPADSIRLAAYRGVIRASGDQELTRILRALSGKPGPSQTAALQLVHECPGTNATRKLAALLPRLAPEVQVALMEGLRQRGDPEAAEPIAGLLRQTASPVRLAAIEALGQLGDASMVPLLGQCAATGQPAEQRAARQALVELRRGPVTQSILAQMAGNTPAVQAELARALGSRGDRVAVSSLLELARRDSGPARKGALQALSLLIDRAQLVRLVELIVEAQSDPARTDAAEALNTACQRLLTHGGFDAEPLSQAVRSGKAEARIALLPVCSGLADAKIRAALRAAVLDSDQQVRAAALRALCDTTDSELLDDLLRIGQGTLEDKYRTWAIAGCVRLANEEGGKLAAARRVSLFKSLLGATPLNADQKRLLLAGLAEVPEPEALGIVEPLLEDAAVRAEAARAAIKIASALPGSQARTASAVLKKILQANPDSATRDAATAALKQIQAEANYLTAWQVAGPYTQNGKDYAALFDIAFPPETPDAPAIQWRPLPAGTDPKRPWVMDCLKALGGEQCVAYARTWIRCEASQPAVLELGSDDGVKVWVNDKMVYAHNIARPLQPWSDKANLALAAGWNCLLLKITQNNQGWEFCARLRTPDGDPLEFEAAASRP